VQQARVQQELLEPEQQVEQQEPAKQEVLLELVQPAPLPQEQGPRHQILQK
jgi:hypothetical protein